MKSLYDKVKLKICVNGECTEEIDNDIGVRQGGPASPILFNIYIEDTIISLFCCQHSPRSKAGSDLHSASFVSS